MVVFTSIAVDIAISIGIGIYMAMAMAMAMTIAIAIALCLVGVEARNFGVDFFYVSCFVDGNILGIVPVGSRLDDCF